eukprot:TRINITY_DN1657_c0_g4_i1.p1 TRINITY_DN1657_c0_g4~~TRINITY_DN1657_c0_g4_i1.p1  ORF type:complete len:1211 (-),score=245.40 TRINITY_DN1657_c0_g4_i1:108-3740(-)
MRMRTPTFLLVALLFSVLIDGSFCTQCTIFAGRDSNESVEPFANGFRTGASINLSSAQIVSLGDGTFLIVSPDLPTGKVLNAAGEIDNFYDYQFSGAVTAAISPDKSKVYVYERGASVIRVLLPPYAETTSKSTGGFFPVTLGVSPSGNQVYSLQNGPGTIEQLTNLGFPLPSANYPVGTCLSMAPNQNFTYVACGTVIHQRDTLLNQVKDFNTVFQNITSIFMDYTAPYPAPLYVVDHYQLVYSFDIVHDTKTLIAGKASAYDPSSDLYGAKDCLDVSFNKILSVATNPSGSLVFVTSSNIYVSVPTSEPVYDNVNTGSTSSGNANTITLNFENYNEENSTVTASFEFDPKNIILSGSTPDIIFADFVFNWWEESSNDVHNVTIYGDSTKTTEVQFDNILVDKNYIISAQFTTSFGTSDPTYYSWGTTTQLVAGPANFTSWTNGTVVDGTDPQTVQFNLLIDHVTFDPVSSVFYYTAYSSKSPYASYIESVTLNGTQTRVAGKLNGAALPSTMMDALGTNAEFIWPTNAVFDPIHRLLYVLDGRTLNNQNYTASTKIRSIDVDNGYDVKTVSIDAGAFLDKFYAMTVNGDGDLIVYTDSFKWYKISGTSYTSTLLQSDNFFYSSTFQVYYTEGAICNNSNVVQCLVVQRSKYARVGDLQLGYIYTVTLDTFTHTKLNIAGDYLFDSLAVTTDGALYVYTNDMGLGKYVPSIGSIAWFGHNEGDNESYNVEYAALANYVSALHGEKNAFQTPPIGFDSIGNAYLLDTSNFRVYNTGVPPVPSPPPVGSITFSSQPDANGYYLSTQQGKLNLTVSYNLNEFSSSKLMLTDGNQVSVEFYDNPVQNTQIHVPLAKANHNVTWQICLIVSVNNTQQSVCSATFGVNDVPKIFHRAFHITPQYYLSLTRTFTLPINDTEDDGVSISAISVLHGTIESYSGIMFTYTAPTYFNGSDRLDYTVCDALGACVTSWSNINVLYTAPNCSLDASWKIPKSQVETHWTLPKLHCNTTFHDKYHYFSAVSSTSDIASFAITGSVGHNSTIVMTLAPNRHGVVSWNFTLSSLAGETYSFYTFTVTVPNNLPTFNTPYTKTWNHLTASDVPYMNILDDCDDKDGDACTLNSLLPGKGATPSTVKQLSPLSICYITLNVILQASPDGTIQLLTAVRSGANYTPGAPVNVRSFKGSIGFQFSAGDGDLDQTGNLYTWSTATITAN